MNASRFACPSSTLRSRDLLRKERKGLLLVLGLAAGAHLLLGQITGARDADKAVKPLSMKFVKRRPRLTKPLELKKRPRPKRRQIRRQRVSVKARSGFQQRVARFQPSQVLTGLARPDAEVSRMSQVGGVTFEPESLAGVIEGTREVEQKIDTSLELLDIEALDTGKHHALVVVDPTDKRAVKGFLHVAAAFPSASLAVQEQYWAQILQALVAAMNRFTDIRTDVRGKHTLDSGELFKIPWLYTRQFYAGFKLTDSEAVNLGQYLLIGGFLFAGGIPQGCTMYTPDTSLREMMKDGLGTHGVEFGKNWNWQKLPDSNAIYHCYFDFAGPPIGQDYDDRWPFIPYLEGIQLGGRLAVVLSLKGYAHH